MDKDNQGQSEVTDHEGPSGGVSPELTGGHGYTFEDSVTAVYVAALLCESTAPGLPGRTVTRVAVQRGSFGQPLDDLIITSMGTDLVSMTYSAQVKRKLVISSAKSNSDFRETIERAYDTVRSSGFKQGLDRVGAIVGELSDGSKRAFETLCEWARAESSSEDFAKKLRTEGVAGEKLTHFEVVRELLLSRVTEEGLDLAAHQLLAHFVLIRMDLLAEGSTTEPGSVSLLANALAPTDRARADDLWRRLLALVRASQGRAAGFDRKTLVASLNGAFRLSGAPSLSTAIAAIEQESRLAVDEIENSISGLNVPRAGHVDAVIEAAKTPGFVQVVGMPGAGKSVVLRSAIESLIASGPVLFLKSDRLQGTTWQQYASMSNIPHASLEDLLIELTASGSGVLFIDGLDRVEFSHRGVVLDLLSMILSSPHLSDWCTVATVRDTGLEPLRTWLPPKLFENGVRTLTVDSFNDDEATALAQARPTLQRLLFGPEAVRAVVRRPFFAAILAKEAESGAEYASSEVDLAALWWKRGGYTGDPTRVGYRRNALVALAKAGAYQLGNRIPVSDVDPGVLEELEADGIIRPVRLGHVVRFAHDIFFEWALLQHLIGEADDWLSVIRRLGEPPALGRVVELLSQAELVHQESWNRFLVMLEADKTLRSQWLRAWMAGPFSLETFKQHSSTFDHALLDPSHERLGKLIVWYQAEKTQPNAGILQLELPGSDIAQRMVYADLYGHPSDVGAWARFCDWLLDHVASLPTQILPDVISAFGVWQNAFAHVPNPVSERIVRTCLAWLYHAEHVRRSRTYSADFGVWCPLNHENLKQLEQSLLTLVLNSAVVEHALIAQYLRDKRYYDGRGQKSVEAVFRYSEILARVCPVELVDFTLAAIRSRLPIDVARNQDFHGSYGTSEWDWSRLSIEGWSLFSPAAPTREPFHSLFKHAPAEACRLVRELSNHSIQAWRQLNRISPRQRGTPIPVVMEFPWGGQVFWGDRQRYLGARGLWGPSAVNSALMAMEAWALREVDSGAPVDDILQKILEGQKSMGVLAVAVAICLHKQHISQASLPIFTNQRIWYLEIDRLVQDRTQTANLMGFRSHEQMHAQAVAEANSYPVRQVDIRSLASIALIKGGELGAQVSVALQQFPDELPFQYVHERGDAAATAELRETAQLWAELGRQENYQLEVDQEASAISISVDNPRARTAEVEERQAAHTEMARHLRLLDWAISYLETGRIKDSLTVEEAVTAAVELNTDGLFDVGYSYLHPTFRCQAAVAGVAAVVIAVDETEHLQWGLDICQQARVIPEVLDWSFTPEAVLPFHPVLFAAKGLIAYFRLATEEVDVLQALLTDSVRDPYEQISITALQGLLGVWQTHPRVAWEALCLATELALFEVRFDVAHDAVHTQRQMYVNQVVDAALERIEGDSPIDAAIPSLPTPWVAVSDAERQPLSRWQGMRQRASAGWRPNSRQVNTAFLQKVMEVIPFEIALADESHANQFLDWCEGLVVWTIDSVAPLWAVDRHDREEIGTELFEWKSYLYRFLAKVSLSLPVEESTRRFLMPALATDDDTFGSLCDWFTSYLVTMIADSPEIPPAALPLLSIITGRILENQGWQYAAEGGRGIGRDSEKIVKDLFFSTLPRALRSARFANGQWEDVGIILPNFEPILRAHGTVEFVASAWMGLCEASFEHYPVQHFVDHLKYLFGPDWRPTGWRGTQLPARLAGLIQRFSDRLHSMDASTARPLLRALDSLVDMGDRRAAAVQLSEVFRSVRVSS